MTSHLLWLIIRLNGNYAELYAYRNTALFAGFLLPEFTIYAIISVGSAAVFHRAVSPPTSEVLMLASVKGGGAYGHK